MVWVGGEVGDGQGGEEGRGGGGERNMQRNVPPEVAIAFWWDRNLQGKEAASPLLCVGLGCLIWPVVPEPEMWLVHTDGSKTDRITGLRTTVTTTKMLTISWIMFCID